MRGSRRRSRFLWRLFPRLVAGILLVASQSAYAGSVVIDATPVPLDPRDRDAAAVGRLEFLAGFALSSDAAGWGGFSGMVLTADGGALLALSDLGVWARLHLRHDEAGRLIGVGPGTLAPLQDEAGQPLSGKRWTDAEALAWDGAGGLLVAFERRHRIRRYPPPRPFEAAAEPVEAPAEIARLPDNGGIEAMAALGPRMLLLSEDGTDPAGDILGWIGAPGSRDSPWDSPGDRPWAALALARTGLFKPTDLAVLPGGDLLLLERRYTPIGGPAARLSILPAAEIRPGARLTGHPVAELRLPLTVDNFEALAVRSAPDGSTLLYLLSDDNLNPLQRTLLLQFRLRE